MQEASDLWTLCLEVSFSVLFVPAEQISCPQGGEGRVQPTDFLRLLQKQQNQKYHEITLCICTAAQSCGRRA